LGPGKWLMNTYLRGLNMKKFLFSAVLSLMFCAPGISFAETIGKGDDYLNFTLEDLYGEKMDLSAHAGKVIFLDIWASWCAPCAKEMPFLVDAYEKYKDQGFVIVAVSVDDKRENIDKFFKRRLKGEKPSFPVLHDPDKKVGELYKVIGMPSTVIIGKDGKIIYGPKVGFEESHITELTKEIESAL